MNKFILILGLIFIALSCQETENPKDDIELLRSKLPKGWKLEVQSYNRLPYQWTGDQAFGQRIKIYQEGSETEVDKAYSQNNETYKTNNKMIRLLYKKIQGGYRYQMMERVHPDQLEAITKNFIIVSPSHMTGDKDVGVPKEIYKVYKEIFHKNKIIVPTVKKDFFTLVNPVKFKGKTTIFEVKENFYESFGIIAD